MSLKSQYNLSQNEEFRNRVTMAVWIAATAIQGEAQNPAKQSLNAKRNALAAEVFTGSKERSFLFAVLTNETISAKSQTGEEITDGDIQYTVNSVWNDLAGVTQADL